MYIFQTTLFLFKKNEFSRQLLKQFCVFDVSFAVRDYLLLFIIISFSLALLLSNIIWNFRLMLKNKSVLSQQV